MSLSLNDFIFERGKSVSNKEMREYIKRIDPYFDLRKLATFFGNRAYQMDGEWHSVLIKSDRVEELDDDLISQAVAVDLLFRVPTLTARADQINAVARARGIDLTFHSDVPDYAIAWKGFIHPAIIQRQCLWAGPGINKPLTAYDLTYWIRIWSDDPSITEDEVIAAMDMPTIRTKLNWEMGTGIAWKGVRLLNAGDLSWYTGAFPDKLAMNDGKNPPPPGEPYGYGYVDMTEVVDKRNEIIGDAE